MVSILDLPIEMIEEITKNLNAFQRRCLSLTCKQLKEDIKVRDMTNFGDYIYSYLNFFHPYSRITRQTVIKLDILLYNLINKVMTNIDSDKEVTSLDIQYELCHMGPYDPTTYMDIDIDRPSTILPHTVVKKLMQQTPIRNMVFERNISVGASVYLTKFLQEILFDLITRPNFGYDIPWDIPDILTCDKFMECARDSQVWGWVRDLDLWWVPSAAHPPLDEMLSCMIEATPHAAARERWQNYYKKYYKKIYGKGDLSSQASQAGPAGQDLDDCELYNVIDHQVQVSEDVTAELKYLHDKYGNWR